MKVRLASWIAMPCAASSIVADPAHHDRADAANRPPSAKDVSPIGQPSVNYPPEDFPVAAPDVPQQLVLRQFDTARKPTRMTTLPSVTSNDATRRPLDAHLWRAPIAEDQRIVDHHVHQRGADRRPQDHGRML